MRRKLPPLNALHTFEAAGRHASFTRASEELGVTPGAVSRQIKLLEELLGVQLFDRTGSELRVTADGKKYLSTLSDLFDQLDSATCQVRDKAREQQLHLYCGMTFTLRWLVPRLNNYHSRYPRRSIRLTTSMPSPFLITSGDIDVGVRQGEGPWPSATVHRLLATQLTPVCSPKLLAKTPLSKLSDIARNTLLHSLARPDDWSNWLKAAGAPSFDPQHNMSFENSSLAYQAAIEGIGCAIGQLALVFDDLIAGRLVAPFDFVLDAGAFQMFYADSHRNNTRLIEFRDWILSEAKLAQDSIDESRPKFAQMASAVRTDRVLLRSVGS